MPNNLYSNLKLLKHLDRLNEWDKGNITYPISVGMHLTNVCNNKCPLCIRTVKNRAQIPAGKAENIILQLKECGIKSIGLGGGGEPTCHPHFSEIVQFIKSAGMEVAVYTNLSKVSVYDLVTILNCCTWLRISLDASDHKMYKKTHGMGKREFEDLINNIHTLMWLRKQRKSNTTIGAGYLVGKHTLSGVLKATELCKDLRLDYIRFRPFFNQSLRDKETIQKLEECIKLQDKKFSVSYPKNRYKPVNYNICHAHHFKTIITADLNVYPCCLLEQKRYSYGSLNKNTFKEIWESKRRKKVIDSIDIRKCPMPCMLDGHNRLLNEIKKPVLHPNWL